MRTVEDNCVGCDWCADCGRKHQEVIYCDKCGDQVWECDVITEDGEDYCLDCWEQHEKEELIKDHEDKLTAESAIKLGESEKGEIKLNGFLVWYFSPSDIEKILAKEMKKDFQSFELIQYLEEDNDIERLKELDR